MTDLVLDEIQWRQPPPFEGGVHNNSVLYYFALSPFYDKTSNNEVLFQQGLANASMAGFLATRDVFEARLKTMSGLEFLVAQEPADTSPGAGTGVWVINKQLRRKRQGEEDEVTVLATYFIDGENIYMAPSLADIISSRLASIATSIATIPPAANALQQFSSATGRTNRKPTTTTTKPTTQPTHNNNNDDVDEDVLQALAAESFLIHERYGHEYMDLNPITGRPGDFHLSSTGRKEKAPAVLAKSAAVLPALDTKVPAAAAAESPLKKETKSPRAGNMPKPRRRKSKGGQTPS